jgi:cysteine synthase A
MHSRTTARELLDDLKGQRFDYWVTGYGTGGTLKGVARVLRQERPETQIVVCEPAEAPLLASGEPQLRLPDGSPAAAHPAWTPHPMQGWVPDFIPKLTGDVADAGLYDRLLTVTGPESIRWSKALAQKEGIFVGITAGATFAGAIEVAKAAEPGAVVVCMLPDTGERYLSTPLFADVGAEMDAEELAIFRSTPMFADAAQPQPAQ